MNFFSMLTVSPIADQGARQVKQRRSSGSKTKGIKLTVSIPRTHQQPAAPKQSTPLKKLTVCVPRTKLPGRPVGGYQPTHGPSGVPIDYHRQGSSSFMMVEGSEQLMQPEQHTSEIVPNLHVFVLTN